MNLNHHWAVLCFPGAALVWASCQPFEGEPIADADETLLAEPNRHAFYAHDETDPDKPYLLPLEGGDFHLCFAFRAPFAPEEQAIAVLPKIDGGWVHHMILSATAQPPPASVFPCEDMPPGATFIAGWAPGSEGIVPPSDVGIELPDDGYVVLDMHYWFGPRQTQIADASGLTVRSTAVQREHTGAFVRVGTTGIHIPCRSEGHEETGECRVPAVQPLTIVGSAPHMHQLGHWIETDIVRQTGVDPLIRIDDWDFEWQTYYPLTPTEIAKGDVVRTSCSYDNPHDHHVFFGESAEDEMCFNYLLVYPVEGLPPVRTCESSEPPSHPLPECAQR